MGFHRSTPSLIAQARETGAGVFTWQPNVLEKIGMALEAGVDAIDSDDPILLRETNDSQFRLYEI
jgi:hypothetical protein